MELSLKNLYLIPAFLASLSPEVQQGYVYTSLAVSSIGLAAGVFNRRTDWTAASLILGANSFIAWNNLDAAAKHRALEREFNLALKVEKSEQERLDRLLGKLSKVADDRRVLKASAEELIQKNESIQGQIKGATDVGKQLKETEEEIKKLIDQLDQQLQIQQEALGQRDTLLKELQAEIKELKDLGKQTTKSLRRSTLYWAQLEKMIKEFPTVKSEEETLETAFARLVGSIEDIRKKILTPVREDDTRSDVSIGATSVRGKRKNSRTQSDFTESKPTKDAKCSLS